MSLIIEKWEAMNNAKLITISFAYRIINYFSCDPAYSVGKYYTSKHVLKSLSSKTKHTMNNQKDGNER